MYVIWTLRILHDLYVNNDRIKSYYIEEYVYIDPNNP